ncbi:GAF domain-containing protein [Pannus brasiliensis CCIBt3594]|uniref:GAF domain-containing protein n=1 Tax=Pannus brasiliensis CCIBt3594 TaxID=1427578 RepID=A0AAW9QZK5_9CHRO
MPPHPFPPAFETALARATPREVFDAFLPVLGEILQVDRCFLLVRDPVRRYHEIFCWRRSDEFPDTSTGGWEKEREWEREDPMFAAALACKPSIFVEDIETAPPNVLNRRFERENLGHRALIHGHLCRDGRLRGILQPCVFDRPRIWSEFDRSVIGSALDRLTSIVVDYVRARE